MSIEVRYAELDLPGGGTETVLDEVVGRGVLHTEDLGGAIMLILDGDDGGRVHVEVVVERLPLALWWDELRDAWYERRWPCFWRPSQRLVDYEEAT